MSLEAPSVPSWHTVIGVLDPGCVAAELRFAPPLESTIEYVVQTGLGSCHRKLPRDHVWRQLGDPFLDEYMQRDMLSVVDLPSANGTLVLWLTHPAIEVREPRTQKAPATLPRVRPRAVYRDQAAKARLRATTGKVDRNAAP